MIDPLEESEFEDSQAGIYLQITNLFEGYKQSSILKCPHEHIHALPSMLIKSFSIQFSVL